MAHKKKHSRLSAALVLSLAWACMLPATSVGFSESAFIVKPTSATASVDSNKAGNTFNDLEFDASEDAMITNNAPIPATWPDSETASNVDFRGWRAWNPNGSEWIRLDLGQDYYVKGLHLWNYLEASRQDSGISTISIDVSTDDSTWASATIVPGDENLDLWADNDPGALRGEDVRLAKRFTARYIRINALVANGYAGLSEVRIIAEPIPHPGTLVILR